MMVEPADTTDFYWSQECGNSSWDALKFGEPSARSVATPSQALKGRCRDWTGATYVIDGSYGQGTVRTTNAVR